MKEFDEYSDDEPRIEKHKKLIEDFREPSLTAEERDEIIRKYNTEYSKKLELSDNEERGSSATYIELLDNVFGIGMTKDSNVTSVNKIVVAPNDPALPIAI